MFDTPKCQDKFLDVFYANISMWNRDAEDFLQSESSQVIMLAEHRLDDFMFSSQIHNKIQTWRRRAFFSPAQRTGTAKWATSGGVMAMPRSYLYTDKLDEDLFSFCTSGPAADPSIAARWTGCILRLKSVSILLIVVYLQTGEELSDTNMAVLHQVCLAVAHFSGEVIIVGDWQMEPATLARFPTLEKLGLRILCPDNVSATCTAGDGRLIDFALVSSPIFSFLKISGDFAVPWDSHAALRIRVPFRPRCFQKPTLSIPRVLPDLPLTDGQHSFSYLTWQQAGKMSEAYIDKWSRGTGLLGASPALLHGMPVGQLQLSKDYCQHATAVEHYALLSSGVSPKNMRPYIGRGALPHVSLRSAIPRHTLNDRFSAPDSSFWSQVSTLLAWLMPTDTGKKPVAGKLLQPIWQLKKLIESVDQHWRRGVAPNAPSAAWKSWVEHLSPAAVLTEQQGYASERISTWRDRALAQKKKAVSVQSSQLKRSFRSWLVKDLASGASGAHAMVKSKPFIPSVPCNETPGIFATWASLWGDSEFAKEAISEWPKHLCRFVQAACVSGSRFAQLADAKRIANAQELLESLTLHDFTSAAKSYPEKKARGVDGWSSNFLHSLPDDAAQGFVNVMNGAQATMTWPIQLMANLISLIPKQQGGERPIAKTPMIYRIWCLARSPAVKSWANDNVSDYDYAAAGRSAVHSAALRSWMNELAVLSGRHVGSLLWDIEKFFDSLQPRLIIQRGLEMGYPIIDLILAMSMHMAPRFMVLSGCISAPILPNVSILAGCMHSVYFARLEMSEPLGAIVRRVSSVKSYSLVDDVAQTAIGHIAKVATELTDAGILFATRMKAIKLKISSKSVVVASNDRLASAIARAISKATGVVIKTQRSGRDLGVLNNPTGKRNTALQQERVRKATIRGGKISKLARSVRKASSLAYTGALPQAIWGAAAVGCSPSVVSRLRTMMASASGIVASGRCRATAIAITMGPTRDPAIVLAMQQIGLWIDLWRSDPSCRALAARNWTVSYNRVVGLRPNDPHHNRSVAIANAVHQPELMRQRARWGAVIGPMTATMATLHDAGWSLMNPARWVDPAGCEWVPDFMADKQPFVELVGEFVSNLIWRHAATGWNGLGLQDGVDWTATLALQRHIATVHGHASDADDAMDPDDPAFVGQSERWAETSLSWLQLFMTGGYWPQHRLAEIHPDQSATCPRCASAPETAFHLLYECAANEDIDDPRISENTDLIFKAREGVRQYPCLWLRGLLPRSLVHVNTPAAVDAQLQYIGNTPCGAWPEGCYHTDASGGPDTSVPIVRRCGVGIAYVAQSDSEFDAPITEQHFHWGAFGVLPGKLQSVVRGELFAILLVVINTKGMIEVVTDSKVNADLYWKGELQCTQSANADLWKELWALLREKGMTLSLVWSKGHADELHTFTKYKVTARNLFGNLCADRLAERGAESARVALQDAMNVKFHYALVRRVQERAVIILQSALQRNTTLTKSQKAKRMRRISATGQTLSSLHNIVSMSRTLHCSKCLAHSSATMQGRMDFLASPCRPDTSMLRAMALGNARPVSVPQGRIVRVGCNQLHASHMLRIYKGLYYCARCGYHASSKAQKLLESCVHRGAAATKRVQHLQKGMLPSGLQCWPADAPQRPQLVELTTSDATQ